ncbi:MAG: hypothetical protein HRU70_07670 [Phycisphaeraceae bacterium]|nr:MAG: hypothetical protein HRU70_07670 [Phycisphaeraceae bacterium]
MIVCAWTVSVLAAGAGWGAGLVGAGMDEEPVSREALCALSSRVPLTGGYEAVYRRAEPSGVMVVAYDAGRRSWYTIEGATARGVDAVGRSFHRKHEPGERGLSYVSFPREDRFDARHVEQFVSPSVFLVEVCRSGMTPVEVVRDGDGLVRFTVTMPMGNRQWAIRGMPDGFRAQDVALTMWVDGEGVVRRVRRGSEAERECVYVPESMGRIPVVERFEDRGEWVLQKLRWIESGMDTMFTPAAVWGRVRSTDMRAAGKPSGIEVGVDAVKDAEGLASAVSGGIVRMDPIAAWRWPLVGAGAAMVVVGVGATLRARKG